MPQSTLSRKIAIMTDCLARIESRVPPTVDQLKSDLDLQELLAINIDRLIDVALEISDALKEDLPDIEDVATEDIFKVLAENRVISFGLGEKLSAAIRFRNLHMYRYAAIDWSMVYSFISSELDAFHEYARDVARKIGFAGLP